MLKRLLSIGGIMGLLVCAAALTIAAGGGGTFTSPLAPNGQTETVAANSSLWFTFNSGKKSEVTATLDSPAASSLRLEIYAPEQITAWQNGGALKPVGIGASFPDHDLGWVGKFKNGGTYYAVVYNDSNAPVSVQVSVTGDTVSTAQTETTTAVDSASITAAVATEATATPTVVAATTSCTGTPVISSFYADDTDLASGDSTTLRWGLVGNADAVYIYTPDGSWGVETPGELGIQPDETSTYTLVAYCQGTSASASVTVNVGDSDDSSSTSTSASGSIDSVDLNYDRPNNGSKIVVHYTWNGQGGAGEICATVTGGDVSDCTTARANAPYAVIYLRADDIRAVNVSLVVDGTEIASGSS